MKILSLLTLLPFLCLAQGTEFELSKTPLPDAISLFYGNVMQKPFMLSPELANDDRLVSFHLFPQNDAMEFFERYLSNMNIKIYNKNGVDYITSYIPKSPPLKIQSYVYTPLYRSVSYLSGVISSNIDVSNTAQIKNGGEGEGAKVDDTDIKRNAGLQVNSNGDSLLFRGTSMQLADVREILPLIDTKVSEIVVSGYVFEVQTNKHNGSGLALAASLVSGKFNIKLGNKAGYDNYISFSSGSLDALYELFSTDSRFNVLSSPRLRVSNGGSATFSVGSEVPVLGAVSYQDDNQIQSVEYRNSGVIFTVKPVITGQAISMSVDQQLSNFVATETGVNNTPTLIKRQISTTVNTNDGQIILLGGLAENKTSNAKTGFSFWPDFTIGESDDDTKTDIIIMLQTKRVSE